MTPQPPAGKREATVGCGEREVPSALLDLPLHTHGKCEVVFVSFDSCYLLQTFLLTLAVSHRWECEKFESLTVSNIG